MEPADNEKFVCPEWRIADASFVLACLDEADARRKLIVAASEYGEHDHAE